MFKTSYIILQTSFFFLISNCVGLQYGGCQLAHQNETGIYAQFVGHQPSTAFSNHREIREKALAKVNFDVFLEFTSEDLSF